MKYEIRKAKKEDLNFIMEIVKNVVENKKGSGLNWNHNYPNREDYLDDIKRDKLYVIVLKDEVLGAIAIYEDLDEEYKLVNWNVKNGLVIHRLIINKNYQNLGLGTLLMQEVEKQAKNLGLKSIKLDTYSKNLQAIKFYKKNKYEIRGGINLKPWEEKFLCFEKLL